MVLHPGAIFAGYAILEMLGSDEAGEVYRAQRGGSSRQDALKVLCETLSADAEFRERFQREAGTASTLYHPNIRQMHDRDEFDGQLWIAMEYVNGTDAAELLRHRYSAGMPAGEALAIVTALAAALDYAHQRGLLHRNVKPANIVLTTPEDGGQRILLSDFGIARQLGDLSEIAPSDLTLSMVAYAAPEQLRGAAIDARADQYALAATAFHLLTGAPPVNNADAATVVNQRLSMGTPRLRDRRPDLVRLDAVLSTALATDPAGRFGGCGQFAEALSEAAGVSMGDRSPEAVLVSPAPAPETHLRSPAPHRTSPKPPRPGAARKPVAPGFLRQPLRGRRQNPPTSAASELSPEPASWQPSARKWPWVLVGAALGAIIVGLGGVLAMGVMNTHKRQEAAPPAVSPTTGSQTPTPGAAPSSGIPAALPPDELVDGTYRVEVDREQQTYNDTPDPQPPNVSTWWAFRSSCAPTGCQATAILLDDQNHQTPSTKSDNELRLQFVDGAWKSNPQTVLFPCLDSTGRPDKQTTTQVVALQPEHGEFRGMMTVTVVTDECGQKDAKIVIPAVAERIGDVPPGVNVPNPAKPPLGTATTSAPGNPAPPTGTTSAPTITETPQAPATTPGR